MKEYKICWSRGRASCKPRRAHENMVATDLLRWILSDAAESNQIGSSSLAELRRDHGDTDKASRKHAFARHLPGMKWGVIIKLRNDLCRKWWVGICWEESHQTHRCRMGFICAGRAWRHHEPAFSHLGSLRPWRGNGLIEQHLLS